jgi:hypothetical protein
MREDLQARYQHQNGDHALRTLQSCLHVGMKKGGVKEKMQEALQANSFRLQGLLLLIAAVHPLKQETDEAVGPSPNGTNLSCPGNAARGAVHVS